MHISKLLSIDHYDGFKQLLVNQRPCCRLLGQLSVFKQMIIVEISSAKGLCQLINKILTLKYKY